MCLTAKDITRFWSSVGVGLPNQCWPWTGETNNKGYGRFCTWHGQRKRFLAHRLAYQLHTGEEISGRGLLHSCDNPPCCNPNHLRCGSQLDNIADMRAKRRHVDPPTLAGEANGIAKLAERDVREILSLSADGLPATAIAPKYHVSPDNVRRIVRRERWTHIALSAPPEGAA